jgi:hypothetical protein
MPKRFKLSCLPKLVEIEALTAALWLRQGAIAVTSTGEENTYYVNEFGNAFYCKNYPR